jgi:predicted phage terminase large subunit-like protein
MASHNAELAEGFGEQARDLVASIGGPAFGYDVKADRQAKSNWGIEGYGGGMECFGVTAGMTGKGADLMIIDDPLDGTKAISAAMRESLKEWWIRTARTRLNPGGHSSVILMQQRTHEDDLAGWLLSKSITARLWEQLCLRAEAEDGEEDPIGRKPGEFLWPLFGASEYLALKDEDSAAWEAQYQQRPSPKDGGMFKEKWIRDNKVRRLPREPFATIRYWDRAATENGGDYTVGVRMSRVGDEYYIEDVVRGQWASGPRDRIIARTCREDNANGPFVVTWGEQEPGSSGKDSALSFEQMLRPNAARCERATGSKEVRADGLAKAFEHGVVHVVLGDGEPPGWYEPLVGELAKFPAGKHDDIVDACSGAFNKLASMSAGSPNAYEAVGEAEYEELLAGGYIS